MFRKTSQIVIILILSVLFMAQLTEKGTATEKVQLTNEELSFIEEHPIIEIGIDPKFVPFEFMDRDGEYKGITADYLSLVEERTGLTFKVRKNLTWPEAYEKALAYEISMLPAI